MGKRCVICPREPSGAPGVKINLYKLPKDPNRRQKWVDALREIGLSTEKDLTSPHIFVCHRHFRAQDFKDERGRKTLRADANPRSVEVLQENIPTVVDEEKDPLECSNTEEDEEKEEAQGCSNTSEQEVPNGHMHKWKECTNEVCKWKINNLEKKVKRLQHSQKTYFLENRRLKRKLKNMNN